MTVEVQATLHFEELGFVDTGTKLNYHGPR